jgi:predicted peroxiredoxin
MEAVKQIVDAVRISSIIDLPDEMMEGQVEVIVLPIHSFNSEVRGLKEEKENTTSERIRKFREKHNYKTFVDHLKKCVAQGVKFDFDVQKLIDGTETLEEKQARYKSEKQTWSKIIQERADKGEL